MLSQAVRSPGDVTMMHQAASQPAKHTIVDKPSLALYERGIKKNCLSFLDALISISIGMRCGALTTKLFVNIDDFNIGR